MIKRFSIITLIGIILFSVTGTYDVRGLESLSYAVAIGLDKGEENARWSCTQNYFHDGNVSRFRFIYEVADASAVVR